MEELSLFNCLIFNIRSMNFHPFLIKLWLTTEKLLELGQSKGNNPAITDGTPIKLHMHNLNMVIHLTKVLFGYVLTSLFLAKC